MCRGECDGYELMTRKMEVEIYCQSFQKKEALSFWVDSWNLNILADTNRLVDFLTFNEKWSQRKKYWKKKHKKKLVSNLKRIKNQTENLKLFQEINIWAFFADIS